MSNKQQGFNAMQIVWVVVVLGLLAGVAWFVYRANQDADPKPAAGSSVTTNPDAAEEKTDSDGDKGYLLIPEAGVKIKLAANTQDAYYAVSADKKANGLPVVSLSTRSLDKYPRCVASETESGVNGISTFKAGETSPVHGDFAKAYPNAPKIDELYFYVTSSQYDCTEGKGTELFGKVKGEFLTAYSTIEKL